MTCVFQSSFTELFNEVKSHIVLIYSAYDRNAMKFMKLENVVNVAVSYCCSLYIIILGIVHIAPNYHVFNKLRYNLLFAVMFITRYTLVHSQIP